MIRAPVYLQLENIDNCKRDLSAILRSNPEHTQAKALHRKVKKFTKAVDDGASQEQSRVWSAALEKYTLAHELFTPPVATAALRAGLCRVHLRMRKAEDAVTWCGKAHNANQDDLDMLFSFADAK